MFFRSVVALYAFAFCVVAINAEIEDEVPTQDIAGVQDDTEGRANPAVKIVAKIIGSLFTGAAASCLGEAANNCKQHWKNPGAAISCAKNFLKANKGRCAVGK